MLLKTHIIIINSLAHPLYNVYMSIRPSVIKSMQIKSLLTDWECQNINSYIKIFSFWYFIDVKS